MSISPEDIKKASKLVRLRFSEDEIALYSNQISNIMKMIDTIEEVDCSGVEPLTSVSDMSLRLRKDEVDLSISTEALFSNTPGKESDLAREIKCFVVPKVVE